ncbi:MAG: insulinase family protein [Bacteroidota bacterium]|nr:insulinase family protein [Bacteroidota bacterium]
MPNRTIAPPIKDAIDYKITLKPYTKFLLLNGAPVYYINDGAEEVAMIDFVFDAGNSFENKNAIAAATNHLIKNGTKNKNAFEITEYFEYYGAYLNRKCGNETASITLHCLSKHLKELLPVIRELIIESIFPESELEIFKQNSIQRLSVDLLKCDFVASRLIDEYLYGAKHPYGKVSNKEDIEAIKREELVSFYENYYLKSRCRIFSAGKLPADFEQLLETQFGDLALNNEVITATHKRDLAIQKKYFINNDEKGVQGAIRIGRPFPNRKHPDFKKTVVLNTLFGGYFGSRLMGNIREEKGYTYGIHSYLENHIQESSWVISTEAGKEVCEATIEEVYKEMKLIRDEPVNDEELLLVKNYMMGLNLGHIDGPFEVISRWKSLILNDLDENYFYDSIRVIKEVTSEELQELANKYLQPEDFYELLVI